MSTKTSLTPEPPTVSTASTVSAARAASYFDLLLITAGAGALLLLITTGDQAAVSFQAIVRLLLAVAYLFLVPGYLLQLAVFPSDKNLGGLARLALSFALSIALIPPLALLLEWLPWRLTFWPILAAWFGLIALLILIVALRRWRQGRAGRLALSFPPALRSISKVNFWQGESRPGRLLLSIAALALITAIFAGVALAITPRPAERFSEFYLLGDGGMAEGYPRTAVVGQPLALLAGIHNLEGQALGYSLRARLGAEVLLQSGGFQLADQAVLELPLSLTLSTPGPDQELTLELFRQGMATPYRMVRLVIDVKLNPAVK